MSKRFDDLFVVVTGGSSGIGLATAIRFADEGACVAVLDTTSLSKSDRLDRTITSIQVDVTAADEVHDAIRQLVAERRGVDILVTAAGIDRCDTVPNTTREEWTRVLDVDLSGVFHAVQAVLPSMIQRRSGSIVTVSSAIGSVGHRRRSAYCAAKGGVENLTRAIALDHGADGIRCNCVAPGLIDTPLIHGGKVGGDDDPSAMQDLVDRFHAIPRIGRPDEVAAAIAFLASDDASFITGAVLPVDAGWNAQ